jgi:hypothetical protein
MPDTFLCNILELARPSALVVVDELGLPPPEAVAVRVFRIRTNIGATRFPSSTRLVNERGSRFVATTVDGALDAEAELGMTYQNIRRLGDRLVADEAEYERLTRRLYDLTEEWERAEQGRRELERQLVADRIEGDGEPRAWATLGHVERRLRIEQLVELGIQVRELERALSWTDRRRDQMLERLASSQRARR